jgi:hypothetical protein
MLKEVLMVYFKDSIRTQDELSLEYHRLAKIYHSDVGGSDEQFKALMLEYAELKAKLSRPFFDDNPDQHARARAIMPFVKDALFPISSLVYGCVLSNMEVKVVIARQNGMDKIMQALDVLMALKDRMKLPLLFFIGEDEGDGIAISYPCTRTQGWVYMGKGQRPVAQKETAGENYKHYKIFANAKYAWAFTLRGEYSYMIQGSVKELKRIL